MDEIKRFIKKKVMLCLLLPLRVLSVKNNRILMINDLNYNYSGNPKYVAEKLLSDYAGCFDIVFSVINPAKYKDLVNGIRFVRVNSLVFFVNAMTARVLLTNSGGFSYIPLRKSQYVMNTWHGGGAYKKCGIHMYTDSFLFRRDLKLSAKKTGVFISSCTRFTEAISDSMLVPKELFWEIGLPRNDMLMHPNEELRRSIRKRIGLREDERLLLFAPTYRKPNGNYFKESIAISYGIDRAQVCAALQARFGGTWRFAFRLHPCITNRDAFQGGGALDLSDYEDMQELLCATDVLINDFSSSMWDFSLTGRPCFIFAEDIAEYIDSTGFYTPITEWPFPIAQNNQELESNILSFDEATYSQRVEAHYAALGSCETGRASDLVCMRIADKCASK